MTPDSPAGHSAAFFDTQRDYWWNEDFLGLIVERLGLGSTRSVLDVGCGLGHWSRVLTRVLPAVTEIAGIDPEEAWVRQARLVDGDRPSTRISVVQGRGEQLPYPDASFDVVTCQTVLIHVADVPAVLREMCRVARPGGTVLVAEPNNLAGQLVRSNVSARSDPEELANAIHFYATCEVGKAKLGEGDNSVGDLLPGYFAEVGLTVVACYLSDKTSPLWPPYSSPEQAALVEAFATSAAEQRCPWSSEETRRYFLAGGGDPAQFLDAWSARQQETQVGLAAIGSGSLWTAGGQMMYLIAGEKPTDGEEPHAGS